MRPQLASLPKKAVLTRLLEMMERARSGRLLVAGPCRHLQELARPLTIADDELGERGMDVVEGVLEGLPLAMGL